ncbi:hypothetical protein C463_07072 [Halorubrum californiense DSM 19288]|uniref:Uncharacterized protein n=1 Tax=Halorubrum californiense DSM 19288 TaxID=1227465 RepID=M0EA76_9EURY|nr:hypothetical protein [Halorubrum californiense]ELZ44701.1 hypothetical protein C463_07072 [Halorubrum californiense DSM 19288]
MESDESVEEYIETLAGRLDGFERSTTTVDDQRVPVFHDRSLSLSKFGLVDTVFVVGTADAASQARAFSEAAFEHGLSLKSKFPRGLGGNLVVYPVVVSETDLADWVRQYGPKHWSSFEFPVVVDPTEGTADYDESSPLWGGIYYKGFRKTAETTIKP